ncbi:MAG: cysteine desulfurase family protein [Nitrospiria bacterium]
MNNAIYLDHIAATRLLPTAYEAMLPYMRDFFGNPQSKHRQGKQARDAIDTARAAISGLIGSDPREIIFTASGSEANNLAIKGVLAARKKKGRHIVTTAIEHYSVAHPLKQLEKQGYEVTWLPVDQMGQVNPAQVDDAIRGDTIMISIHHANNEIGTIQALEAIGRIAENKGLVFHADAVATVGIIPFDCNALGVDLSSFSSQQMYGPKGVGVLYLRRGVRIHPLIEGGVQENGRRAGTENVAGIVGMGVAAEEASKRMTREIPRLTRLRDRLIDRVLKAVPLAHLTGSRSHRLPHIASFALEYLDGESLVRTLERHGIMAASGSSCSSDALKISPVLTAIGLPGNVAQGSIVFSLGIETTEEEIDTLIRVLPECVETLRRVSPLYTDRLAERILKQSG